MRKNQRRPLGPSDGIDKRRKRKGSNSSAMTSNISVQKKKKKKRGSSSSQDSRRSNSRKGSSRKKKPKFLKFHLRKYNQMVNIDLNNYEIIGKGSFGIVFITPLHYLNESPPPGSRSPLFRGQSMGSPNSPTTAYFLEPPQEQQVAIKRVFQDERYKNRELEIMKLLNKEFQHYNLVGFHYYFYEEDRSRSRSSSHKRYLNIVMEYLPDQTLYHFYKRFNGLSIHTPSLSFGSNNNIPSSTNPPDRIIYNFTSNTKNQLYYHIKTDPRKHLFLLKIFMYQLVKSVNYLHCLDVCHRDIKFQNILLDLTQQSVKLCDFGSAKILQKNEKNISYICSRYYRAPELIFGHRNYNYKIDNWSIGCVFGEMLLLGKPLFKGESSNDQMLKIINFLGSPTPEESLFLCKYRNNGNDSSASETSDFPFVKKKNMCEYFSKKSPKFFKKLPLPEQQLAVNFLENLVSYDEKNRVDLLCLLGHPFFNQIKVPYRKKAREEDGGAYIQPFKVNPNIFNFHLIELKDWKKKIGGKDNQRYIKDYIKKNMKFGQFKKVLNFQ